MVSDQDVKQMSKPEKLWLFETIWRDLSGDEAGLASPGWHEEILQQTEALVAEGKATFSEWSEARQRIRNAVENS